MSSLSPVMAYSIGDQVSYNMTKGIFLFGQDTMPMCDPLNFDYTQRNMFWGASKIEHSPHDYLLLSDDMFPKVEYEIIHDKYGMVGCNTYETLYNYTVGGTISHYHPKDGKTFPFKKEVDKNDKENIKYIS